MTDKNADLKSKYDDLNRQLSGLSIDGNHLLNQIASLEDDKAKVQRISETKDKYISFLRKNLEKQKQDFNDLRLQMNKGEVAFVKEDFATFSILDSQSILMGGCDNFSMRIENAKTKLEQPDF